LRAGALSLFGAALLLAGCGGEDLTSFEGADTTNGKELFVQGPGEGKQSCGGCHTLADAATVSQIGPSLDDAFRRMREEGFDDSTIFAVTLNQIDLAAPPMPADIVTGQDAVDVAAYVARVAGKPPQQQQQQQGGGTTTGATTGAATTTP
jgi:mono/diheme cytochrome c family protein